MTWLGLKIIWVESFAELFEKAKNATSLDFNQPTHGIFLAPTHEKTCYKKLCRISRTIQQYNYFLPIMIFHFSPYTLKEIPCCRNSQILNAFEKYFSFLVSKNIPAFVSIMLNSKLCLTLELTIFPWKIHFIIHNL